MRNIETFKTAFTALKANKLRSFLTMLGIVIGVASVVLLVSLVEGVQRYITDQFNALGSNLVFVAPGRAGFNQDPALAFTDNKLEEKHISLIETEAGDYAEDVVPLITFGKTLSYRAKKYFTMMNGSYAAYSDIFNMEIEKGNFFTDLDDSGNKNFIVLGHTVAQNLFGVEDPLGKTVKLDSKPFIVVGVFKEKGEDFDDQGVVPFNTAKKILGINQISYLTLRIKEGVPVDLGSKYVEMALLKDLKKEDFSLMTQKDLLSSITQILTAISAGLGAVAGISLLVGGIGIMNIMLVSVTERIKEIGLRKALGATSFNIGSQFLIESITLSLSGGLIGLIVGFIGTLIARNWINAQVPVWAVFLSLSFSIFVGVVFGTYPAIKASKKDPVEALRYE